MKNDTSIIDFFRDLWKSKKKHGATLTPYQVYFFDGLPGIPVVFHHFCEIEDHFGCVVNINGIKEILDFGKEV